MIPSGILNPQILSKTGTLEKHPVDRTAVFKGKKHFRSLKACMQNYSEVNVYTQVIKIRLKCGNGLVTTVKNCIGTHS